MCVSTTVPLTIKYTKSINLRRREGWTCEMQYRQIQIQEMKNLALYFHFYLSDHDFHDLQEITLCGVVFGPPQK